MVWLGEEKVRRAPKIEYKKFKFRWSGNMIEGKHNNNTSKVKAIVLQSMWIMSKKYSTIYFEILKIFSQKNIWKEACLWMAFKIEKSIRLEKNQTKFNKSSLSWLIE